jgi:rRNA maturation protein Nop10
MKNSRLCPEGHRYTKSSDCPVCPVCEQRKKPVEGWQAPLSAPARRALEQKGIHSLEVLSQFREAEILAMHGIGKASFPLLRKALAEEGRSFQE